MKKGVAGVRLCDVSGCYASWPCERHGSAVAFPSFVRLSDAKAQCGTIANAMQYMHARFLERSVCARCGYQQCAQDCEPEPSPSRRGWEYLGQDVYMLISTHGDGMVVKRDPLIPSAVQFPWRAITEDDGDNYVSLLGAMLAVERWAALRCADE